ncbi:hypothetical protein CHS0354_003218 [Potamilus streckersoni]|uniref:E3 ubiquitin-protein ligase E3D n=1 Tax=Potamilus streckersoni TaxID=2493646 RepID=A0AAE0SJY9_9BIVA|nr:hypothetical protein CHS0354_003218 [Potamilus streckersoni]
MALQSSVVYAELKKSLSSLTVVIRLDSITIRWSFDEATIDIETDRIVLITPESKDALIFQLEGIELSPLTCRGLKFLSSGEITFTAQLQKSGSDINIKDGVITKTVETMETARTSFTSRQSIMVDKVQQFQDKWYCFKCGQKLLFHNCIFSRILPLPSENWSDFTDMWFCHKHDNGEDALLDKGKLLPKSGECFVGDTYMLVNYSYAGPNSVRITEDSMAMCTRCGGQLGTLEAMESQDQNGFHGNKGCLKLYLHTIYIGNIDALTFEDTNRDVTHFEHFLSVLLIEQSQMFTSYRFIIESSTLPDRKIQCLVWLLDTDLTIFRGEGKIGHGQVEVKKENVIKLLYKCKLSNNLQNGMSECVTNAVFSLWKKDNSVHSLSLPYSTALQMMSTLIANTRCLPPSLRYLNGFHVSFLHLQGDIT